jgi:exopolysaccharide production protein ExoQ
MSQQASQPAAPTENRKIGAALGAFAIAAAAMAPIDPLAAGILLFAPLLPFAIYSVQRGISGDRNFGAALAVVLFFIACANFRYREVTEKSIDFQVALKLVAIAALFGLAAMNMRNILGNLYTRGLIYWLLFLFYLLVTTIYAMAPQPAFVSVISMFASFLFLCHFCVRYNREQVIQIIVYLGLILCATSLVVYVVAPSFGRMKDWVGDDLVVTSRLQGLFGTSNGAGCSAAAILFVTATLYARGPDSRRIVTIFTLGSAGLCLVLSQNRMAIASLAFSFGIYFVLRGNVWRKVLLLIAIGLLGGSVLVLLADEILALVSRSGSAEEITSATGRTRIWPVVIDLWSMTPLLGRGFGSGQYILPLHPDLFAAAAHAHNLYLESLFTGGLIQLALLMWCTLTTLVLAIRVRATGEFALFCFYLLYGLTEPVINGPLSVPVLIWFTTVVLILHRAKAIYRSRRKGLA